MKRNAMSFVWLGLTLCGITAGTLYVMNSMAVEPLDILAADGLTPLDRASSLTVPAEPAEELSGGETTVPDTSVRSFGRVVRNLTSFDKRWNPFHRGKAIFDRDWTTIANSPLGPMFSSTSCDGCHEHDGRGRPPGEHEMPESMVMQLTSIGPNGEQKPDPVYGGQLDYQSMTSEGGYGEGYVRIIYDNITGQFADGERFSLRSPSYDFRRMQHGDLDPSTRFSARLAPPLSGAGLLEAIPDSAIMSHVDPDDRDHDGISGRPNLVHDVASDRTVLGRFGWKANQPTLTQQILRAFRSDMGIASDAYPDTTATANGARPVTRGELDSLEFFEIVYYTKLLAVPARRHWTDARVLHGKALFQAAGCVGCHTPSFTTGVMKDYPEISNQKIRPYTDLLLHDMGEGLADGRPDGLAGGREWRTPALWGLGLATVIAGHSCYLHDGRARNLEEAVLWHGGEAIEAQRYYRRLPKADRTALLEFLQSL